MYKITLLIYNWPKKRKKKKKTDKIVSAQLIVQVQANILRLLPITEYIHIQMRDSRILKFRTPRPK